MRIEELSDVRTITEYASKRYNLDYLKKINIQDCGTYWDVPSEYLTEEGRKYFGVSSTDVLSDIHIQLNNEEIYSQNYVNKDYLSNINCEFYKELFIEFINELMKKDYDSYLVVLFDSTWNNLTGIKICNKYIDCFYRGYDCTMNYVFSSPKGKVLSLREFSHDCPTGYTSVIIGLTERETEKVEKMNVDEVIKFSKKFI